MKKLYKVVEESEEKILYKWNGQEGKGKVLTIFRGEFNYWYAAQLEGGDRIEIPENCRHIIQVAALFGLK